LNAADNTIVKTADGKFGIKKQVDGRFVVTKDKELDDVFQTFAQALDYVLKEDK
jgi:hypothetical protein